jgi:biotin-dependent carboxylase-like uncharacterized protein
MSVVLIEEVGPATSVQDLGRFGAIRYGLGTAGAMDRFGMACANVLVGQSWDAPVIEIGPLPMRLKVKEGTIRFAVAGAQRGMTLNGAPVPMNESFTLTEDEVLVMRAAKGGVFSYLAFEGGIFGTPSFGSFSVHRRAGLGSPLARPFEGGDVLDVGNAQTGSERSLSVLQAQTEPIRCVLGPQDDYFSPDMVEQFFATDWVISATSDRMGYRLEGPPLTHARSPNIVSDGIAYGSLQIPGNGQPLLLLADRGTTGGYPKIATVMTADLGRAAQTPVGSVVRFQPVPIAEAQEATRQFNQRIRTLHTQCRWVGQEGISSDVLFAGHGAGHAVNALDPQA